MTEQQKKIVFIIAFVMFFVAAAFVIYFVFFRSFGEFPGITTNTSNQNVNGVLPSTNVNVNRPSDNTNSGIPIINGTGGATDIQPGESTLNTVVQTIIRDEVDQVKVNPQTGSIVYYDKTDGKFYETNQVGGTKNELTPQAFLNAENITFSNNGKNAVIEFPDNVKIVYDFNEDKQYSLPEDAHDFSFGPENDEIAYKYLPTSVEDRWIVTANIDGSGVKFIEPLGDKASDVDVNWSPKGDVVATFRKSFNAGSQEIFFIGLQSENFKSAVTEGRGFQASWSADGEQMIYSVYNDSSNYNPILYVMNASGDAIGSGRTALELNTWPDKCTFSGAFVYCAEPRFLPPGTGLHPELADESDDRFYEINLITGTKRLVGDPYGVSAKDLWLSSDGESLYFRNVQTGRIQSISIE